MATPNPPTPPREPTPPPEVPLPQREPKPAVAPPEVPAPSVEPSPAVEPVEPPLTPDPPMPEPGFPVPIWDAVAPPPSRSSTPSVTRGAADVDTGEVPLIDPLEAPSDAW